MSRAFALFVVLVDLLLAAPVLGEDAAIKGVLDDLARIEPQIAALTPAQGAGIKRLQNLLNLTAQRLDAADHADPDYPAVSGRLAKAQQAMRELAAGKAPGAAPQPAPSQATPRSSNPEIASLQDQLQTLSDTVTATRPDQIDRIKQERDEIGRLESRMKATRNPADPGWAAAAKGYNELVAKLNALITAAKNGGQAPAASAPGESNANAAGAAQAQGGDVDRRLVEIDAYAKGIVVPPPLARLSDKDQAAAYGTAIAEIRKRSAEALAYLTSINGKVALSHEQAASFNRAQNLLGVIKAQQVDQSLQVSTAALDGAVQQGLNYAKRLDAADTGNPDDQANLMTGADKFAAYRKDLAAGLVAVEAASALDVAIGRTGGPDRAEQRRTLEAAIARYGESHATALAAVRMPEAKSDDPKLLAVAAEVLGRPEYQHAFKRMVINYDLHHGDKTTGDIDASTDDTLTVTVYHWVWDEFQVTTAEQQGGKWYLYANRLRNFTSGGPTTPTGRWILADRVQGSEILEENIEK